MWTTRVSRVPCVSPLASLAVALVVIIHQPWLQLLFRSADNHVPCTIVIEDHVERSSPRFARFVKPRVSIIFLRLFQLLFIGEKSRKINTKNKKRSIFPFIKLSCECWRISTIRDSYIFLNFYIFLYFFKFHTSFKLISRITSTIII